jgi:soluble lytic murein transglycosylase-like protein
MKLRLGLAICLLPLTVLANCWEQAGARYDIDPLLLYAIGEQESGLRADALNFNKDGSYDMGLMQINSRHLPRLAKLGIREEQLKRDACVSVMVGASILSEFRQRFGGTWEAVGAYNAGSSSRAHKTRIKYSLRVWNRYQRLRLRKLALLAAREAQDLA